MGMVVLKFGGTSIGDGTRLHQVAERIAKIYREGNRCIVIVSAMGKATDDLIRLSYQASRAPGQREMDMLLSTGEQVSVALLTMALHEKGLPAYPMTGWQAGISTNDVHGKAQIKEIDSKRIYNRLEQGEIVVVAGFQGISLSGEITTLGRGGSDTTAVTLAAALLAERCEIYTDVAGVYTADPRIVPHAHKLEEISYEEMLELANLGATVLHPRAVECALIHQVPLVVRSSFSDEPGTWVKGDLTMEKVVTVRGVVHDEAVARIKVLGMKGELDALSRLFGRLADAGINVDIIVQSEHYLEPIDVAFSVDESEWKRAEKVIQQHKQELQYTDLVTETGLAKVSVVGAGMASNPGVAAKMFAILAEKGIRMKMVSTSEIKISCVIHRDLAEEAVRGLHTAFGLDGAFQAL